MDAQARVDTKKKELISDYATAAASELGGVGDITNRDPAFVVGGASSPYGTVFAHPPSARFAKLGT